jgi:hypothetical protein
MERLNGKTDAARRIYRAVMVEGQAVQDVAVAEGLTVEETLTLLELYSEFCEITFRRVVGVLKTLPLPVADSVRASGDFVDAVYGVAA